MKKADLVDVVSQKNSLLKAQTQQVLEDIIEEIALALSRGDKIDLRGFGTFSVRDSKPRPGRNPQTGDTIHIPARRVPCFKAGKDLRERCNTEGAKL